MITDKLIEEFLDSPIGQNVVSKLKFVGAHGHAPLQELYFHGLTDSAKGFFLTSLIHSANKPILYLASDINIALNLYHEISNLTKLPVFYFPSQEVSPYDQIASDVDIISHQTRTLTHLLNEKKPCLIISTGKCLAEKVWNKEDLTKHYFEINYNTKIDPLDIAKKLVTLGYKKAQMVTTRGEFSIRGDIFDIFQICGEPTRIEFYGDEIESIRTYSPTTQRSQDNTDKVIITPRYYIVNPSASDLPDKVAECCKNDNDLKELANKEIEQLKTNNYPESIEYYSQLASQKTSSLFDYLPKESLLLVDDWEATAIALENSFQRNLEIKKELESNKKIIPLPELLVWDPEYIIKNLKKYSTSYIERFELFDKSGPESINLCFSPQERFNNQIEKFTEKIKEWISLKNKIIIFSD